MLFPKTPENEEDIRAFCNVFNEGVRVEYKSDLDQAVRQKIPKIVSSFANALGGVLVIGVKAAGGVPQQPVEGFDAPPREEVRLTVENLCLQGINPPVLPRTTVVSSSTAGKIFLVIEVDESWEAPHAIENSKSVYVRTGDASNPYTLAEVDLIIELVRRRDGPARLRDKLIETARARAKNLLPEKQPYAELILCPPFPRRSLCTPDEIWEFLLQNRFQGGHVFPRETLRRIEDGVSSPNKDFEYAELNRYGLLLFRRSIPLTKFSDSPSHPGPECLDFSWVIHGCIKFFWMARTFYDSFGYRGGLSTSLRLGNRARLPMPFMNTKFCKPEDFASLDETTTAEQLSSTERLKPSLEESVYQLAQVCWSYWQGSDEFPSAAVREGLTNRLRAMKLS